MNAYLLELLTYLFRLCFNQCNASLHFGSSKHSLISKPLPPSTLVLFSYRIPLQVLMLLFSHQLLLLYGGSGSQYSIQKIRSPIGHFVLSESGVTIAKLHPSNSHPIWLMHPCASVVSSTRFACICTFEIGVSLTTVPGK